jgi:hypothetical protein
MSTREDSGKSGHVDAGKRKAASTWKGWFAALAAVPLALVAPSAHATTTDDNAPSTTVEVTVKSYNAGDSGRVFVQIRNATTNAVINCPPPSGHGDYWISTAHPRFAQMYSAIQAAALSQRKIRLSYEFLAASSNACWIKRVQVEF